MRSYLAAFKQQAIRAQFSCPEKSNVPTMGPTLSVKFPRVEIAKVIKCPTYIRGPPLGLNTDRCISTDEFDWVDDAVRPLFRHIIQQKTSINFQKCTKCYCPFYKHNCLSCSLNYFFVWNGLRDVLSPLLPQNSICLVKIIGFHWSTRVPSACSERYSFSPKNKFP